MSVHFERKKKKSKEKSFTSWEMNLIFEFDWEQEIEIDVPFSIELESCCKDDSRFVNADLIDVNELSNSFNGSVDCYKIVVFFLKKSFENDQNQM